MRVPLTALLTYYRNSLADADRMSPEDSLIQTALETSSQEWLDAQLARENIEKIWQAKSPNGKTEMDEWGRKRYWYCPWVGSLKPEHGAQRHGLPVRLVPLWIPVRISEQGIIEPDPVLLPWIPRNLLDPIYPSRLVLGHVHDSDTYIAANLWIEPEPFEDETPAEYRARRMALWFDYGCKLVEYVTKQKWNDFQLDEYYKEPHGIAIPAGAPSAKISGLLAHYDALIRDKITTPPLHRFVMGASFPDVDPLASNDDPRALHIAHIPGFPELSEDQRSALHLALKHHPDLLSVQGPPGTGKTKWIVELALQAYVESALNKEATPPIQIWVAGTNQAIHSSLNTLKSGIAAARWAYPQVRGLGIWCAAKSQQKEQLSLEHDWVGFRWADGLPEGSPSAWGNEDAVIEAIQALQNAAQAHFGKFMELPQIQEAIWEELNHSVQPLRMTWRLFQRDRQRQETIKALLTAVKWPTEFEEYAAHITALYAKRKKAIERVHYIIKEWNDHVQNTPLWITLTASLPGSGNRYLQRNRDFFQRFKLTLKNVDLSNNELIQTALVKLNRDVETLFKQTQQQYQEIKKLNIEKNDIAVHWAQLSEKWSETPRWYSDGSVDSTWEARSDTVHRAAATIWAIRYWEVAFLIKRTEFFKNAKSGRLRGKLEGWKELACLTPMLATTSHSAPRFFQDSFDERDIRPLYGMAHRIVVEESSQASPDIVTGLLSFARSAVMVGDESQLRPIWSVPEKTDIGNLITHQLMDHPGQINDWRESELMSSNGSALLRAKKAGLNVFLKEQHRSHPDLVAFANRLCYNNTIVSTRTDYDPEWPAFAYGHVVGMVDQQLGSRGNRIEAQVIAQYLVKMAPSLKARYKVKKLGEILAIVTPFTRQVHWLKQELSKRLAPEDIPSVGTVHAYQGSEKPIMMFSAVQVTHGQEIPFFDMDNTMLNVAVSRARDAFWYVGNLNGLTSKGLRPSAILAQSLVKGPYQRLPQWVLPFDTPHDFQVLNPMSSDEKGRLEVLRGFLYEPTNGTIHIASPFFNGDYMEKVDFWGWAKNTILRGGNIVIHANKPIMTFHGDSNAGDLVRLASSYGITWNWYQGLFDSRIWTPTKMAESSSPWLAPLEGDHYIVYEGPVQLWCQAQMGSWHPLNKTSTFGTRLDDA